MPVKEKKSVAMVKRACPVCGKVYDGEILISKNTAQDLSEIDKQVVGFLDEPCDKCKEYMQLGVIFVGVDVEKTDDMKNPYRSGDFSVIKESSKVFEVINESQRSRILKSRVCFIDSRIGYQLGVFQKN